MKFNNNFLLGAATSAHQVEGNNTKSDLWIMEQLKTSTHKEPSLDAADHYNRYKEDLQLLREAGLDSYRFTIEWARIEPEEGQFSKEEVEHYREKLEYCHKLGLTPIVTLHHFSSPFWLTRLGGWENEETIVYFTRYTRYIVEELGELIPFICTINEANIGVQITKLVEKMKKGKGKSSDIQVGLSAEMKQEMEEYYREIGEAFQADPRVINSFLSPKTDNGTKIIMTAHLKASEMIKKLKPNIQVGMTFSLHDNQARLGGEEHVLQTYKEDFVDFLPYLENDDFIGLQNYTRQVFDENGLVELEGIRLTKMGYEFYPEALANVARFIAKYWEKDILITESGISTDDDKERIEFIEESLKGIKECLDEGINVIGYLHWSLLDNYEFQLGYDQKFGLIAINRDTKERTPKDSLYYLGTFK